MLRNAQHSALRSVQSNALRYVLRHARPALACRALASPAYQKEIEG